MGKEKYKQKTKECLNVSNLKLQQQNHKNVYEIIRITKLGLLFFTKRVVCK